MRSSHESFIPGLPPEPVRRLRVEVPVGVGHRQDVPVEVVHQVGVLASHRPGPLHELPDEEHDGGGRDPLSVDKVNLTPIIQYKYKRFQRCNLQ